MMKRRPLAVALAALLVAQQAFGQSLDAGFADPPRQARPMAWWHWVSGNISKEGIRADLEDMKRAGLGGAQIFDVDLYQPHGPVRYNSDSWHEHVQYAIAVADELGLEISTMACAGWSEAAGPWITPDKSMKKLVFSETDADGGKPVRLKVAQPETKKDFYRDVAVFAVPTDDDAELAKPTLTSSIDVTPLADGDAKTAVTFKSDPKDASVTFAYEKPIRLSHLTITPPAGMSGRLVYQGKIESSLDGKTFSTVKSFNENNATRETIDVPFASTEARFFRVSFLGVATRQPFPLAFGDLKLSNEYRVEELPTKIGMEDPRPESLIAEWRAPDPLALKPQQIITLTDRMRSDGTLDWPDAPAGRWTIVRVGFTTTGSTNHPAAPEGLGLEVDKFDADAVAFQFDKGLARLIKDAGPRAGKTYDGILFDSWEAGPQNWTDQMPRLFKEKRGYDLTPWLPALCGRVIGSRGETEAFLSDYRRTLGELFAEVFFRTMTRLAHEHGLKTYAETYNGVLDEAAASAEVDVPMGEFWMHNMSPSVQQASSVAHTTGKPIVAAESFTARPPDGMWKEHPAMLKPVGDAALAEGINRIALHTYVHQPRSDIAPGFTSSRYGPHFGRLNTWWPMARPWLDGVARSQFLLQRGRSAKDLLYVRHDGTSPANWRAHYPTVPAGFAMDLISQPVLMKAEAKGGRVVLGDVGQSYRAIVMPEQWSASVEMLKKLAALKQAGVPIFGPPPTCPSTLIDVRERADEWQSLAKQVFPSENVTPLDKALAEAKLAPDATFTAADGKPADVMFAHRIDGDADVYFVTNQSKGPITIDASFRDARGRVPELFDVDTGGVAPARFHVEADRTIVPLALEAADSVFVVFRKAGAPSATVVANRIDGTSATDAAAQPLVLPGPWMVSFQEKRGAPASLAMPTLAPLNESADNGVKFFSGVATYTTTFDVSQAPAGRVMLNLGEVNVIADVKVNGQPAGIAWRPPYTLDVTKLIRPGRNELSVAVANLWVNRLIGDEFLPADLEYATKGSKFTIGKIDKFPTWWNDAGYLAKRERIALPSWRHYTKDDALVPSGLVGPVRLVVEPAR